LLCVQKLASIRGSEICPKVARWWLFVILEKNVHEQEDDTGVRK
jgi:hypothetical protein